MPSTPMSPAQGNSPYGKSTWGRRCPARHLHDHGRHEPQATVHISTLTPKLGITSTPVIDPVAGIIYVVREDQADRRQPYHFFLHALDLISGTEQLAGPTEITGQVNGSGTGKQRVVFWFFDPTFHLQRPGLLLMNGIVYLAFGSVGDMGNFHGWVMGYDATTSPAGVNSQPDSQWQRRREYGQLGRGLAGDTAGNMLRHDRKRRF